MHWFRRANENHAPISGSSPVSRAPFCCSGHAAAAAPRRDREGRHPVQGDAGEGGRVDAGRGGRADVPLADDGESGPVPRRDRVRGVRDPDVVLEPVPAGVRAAAEAVPLRVLPEVHQEQGGAGAAPGQVHVEASARHGDISVRGGVGVRGGWEREQDLLSEFVLVGQAVPGSQDALL